jgi:hypothetical protein
METVANMYAQSPSWAMMTGVALVAVFGIVVGGWVLLTDDWPEKLRSNDDE